MSLIHVVFCDTLRTDSLNDTQINLGFKGETNLIDLFATRDVSPFQIIYDRFWLSSVLKRNDPQDYICITTQRTAIFTSNHTQLKTLGYRIEIGQRYVSTNNSKVIQSSSSYTDKF